jgi:uncharacterized membrane protein YqjE
VAAVDIAHDDVVRGGAAATETSTTRRGPAAPQDASFEPGTARQPPHATKQPRPSVAQVIEEVRAAFAARFHLFELEAQRAAWAAAYMMAFAVGAALLGVTAWLILIGALIVGAVAAGVPWVAAVIVAIALHAIGVVFLVRGIRSMVENLTFAATRRTLSENATKAQHGGSA